MENKVLRFAKHMLVTIIFSFSFTASYAALSSFDSSMFEYKDGLISVKGSHIPLVPLLEQFSETTGMEIFVFDPIGHDYVNLDFKDKSIRDALRSILKGHNYAVLFAKEDPLSGVYTMTTAARSPSGSRYDDASTGERREATAAGSPAAPPARPPEGDIRRGDEEPNVVGGASNTEKINSGSHLPSGFSAATGGGGEVNRPTYAELDRALQNDEDAPAISQADEEEYFDRNGNEFATADSVSNTERLSAMIEEIERRLASGESDRHYDFWVERQGSPQYVQDDRKLLEFYKRRLAGME